MKLYDNIKTLREKLGLSQEELAHRVGYKDRTSIAKIEAGKIDIPQSKIVAFAKALNTTPVDLMGWEDNTGYYSEPEAAEYAEYARTNPNIRILFSASKDISKEQMEKAVEYIQFLKSKEKGDDTD